MKTDKKRVKIRRKAFEENSDLITSRNRNRLAFGFGVILALLFALIFRMGYWQIYKSDELKVNIANFLKEIYYRFYDEGPEWKTGYDKYSTVVKTGQPL